MVTAATLGACATSPPESGTPGNPSVTPTNPNVGPLHVYRLLQADSFPERTVVPKETDGWTWGQASWLTGNGHYVGIFGSPSDRPAELYAHRNIPPATLPPGGRLLFFGSLITLRPPGRWRFQTVAILDPPVLTAADVATCTVEAREGREMVAGQLQKTQERPWLIVHWTPEAEKRLRAVSPKTAFTVAFGDDALTWAWEPHALEDPSADLTGEFQIEAGDYPAMSERAETLRLACVSETSALRGGRSP
jgi:hypothetical protein